MITHELKTTSPEAVLIEIIPKKRVEKSIFILKVYSSPRKHSEDFNDLFWETRQLAKSNEALTMGDFNAPHAYRHYTYDTPKGKKAG